MLTTFYGLIDCAGSFLLHTGFLELQIVGLLFTAMHGLLIAVASFVAEHKV